MAADKVRYVGQEVAAVAAEDEQAAEEALGLINVQYEKLPAVFDPEEAMEPGAPKIHDMQGNLIHEISSEFGNVRKGFEDADLVVEDRFVMRHVHPCNLEPMVCRAGFDDCGNLTFYENSLDPFARRRLVAKACGMLTVMPTAAALANTIYNAVGVRIKDLPITPMKILKALREKRGQTQNAVA